MTRAVLQAWLPWLAVLVACFVVARVLLRLSGGRLRLGRLRSLHRDERGAVQGLSFVLTLPLFIMIILFIVQVSQLMIGIVVVHYAAYAAARSASVWIPARLPGEPENRISAYAADPDAPDQVFPILDPEDPNYGPADGGVTYVVAPGSVKFNKIATAAVMACMPISPSRSKGFTLEGENALAADALKTLYAGMAPSSNSNARIPLRLENKLAWSLQNTTVEMRFFHKNEEPPLRTYLEEDALEEFAYNELGWQDQVTIKVQHNMALLPGAGRLLAGYVLGYHKGDRASTSASSSSSSSSSGSSSAGRSSSSASGSSGSQTSYGQSSYPLRASITMGIEGEKLVIPYTYDVF
jgi:uncharacterized membrane protein YgcG